MMIKKIKQTLLILAFLIGVGGLLVAPIAFAACGTDGDGKPIDTTVIDCPTTGGVNADVENTGVWGLLVLIINILTAGIGIAAVGGIVYAAILYTTAADSAEQTKKAISIIINVAVGLIAYALMYALLNFIIPGGVVPF